MAGPIKRIFGYMGDFATGIWNGDWNGDKLGEAILPDGIKGIPKNVGEIRNDWSGVSEQLEYNKMMSDTAYQRAVEDMKKAGINPAMMYASGGNGASTPNGANASNTVGKAMDMIGQVGNLVNSINTARQIDYYTKQNQLRDKTTRKAYDNASSILSIIKHLM